MRTLSARLYCPPVSAPGSLSRAGNWARSRVKRQLAKRGYAIVQRRHGDLTDEFWRLYAQCQSETMTSLARLAALHDSLKYVVNAQIPGDFVECGVWRGGSAMMAALTLRTIGVQDRGLYLFDTFRGMPTPTNLDVDVTGTHASTTWAQAQRGEHTDWCFAPREVVARNMASTGYPDALIHLVEGRVEDTLPDQAPRTISVLRLDTDWYESTRHELLTLWPRLSPRGVLIIDDYAYWAGARRAVDEWLSMCETPPFLNRIDDSARLAIKP